MFFDGFFVDTIWGFRQHFSIQGVVDALKNPFVLLHWLERIQYSGSLTETENACIQQMQNDFHLFHNKNTCNRFHELVQISPKNETFVKKLYQWANSVSTQQQTQYHYVCVLLLQFLELGQYTIQEHSADEELICAYLEQEFYIHTQKLSLKRIHETEVGIYHGKNLVAAIPDLQTILPKDTVLFVSSNPDTGYIAIDTAGNIVNKSAFVVPALSQKAVYVSLNHVGFVILLEDGSVVHNIKFCKLPQTPMQMVTLEGEQLIYQHMGGEQYVTDQ